MCHAIDFFAENLAVFRTSNLLEALLRKNKAMGSSLGAGFLSFSIVSCHDVHL